MRFHVPSIASQINKMQFDKFCESSLSRCFGKYAFPWSAPNTEETRLSQTTLDAIVSDLDRIGQSSAM